MHRTAVASCSAALKTLTRTPMGILGALGTLGPL